MLVNAIFLSIKLFPSYNFLKDHKHLSFLQVRPILCLSLATILLVSAIMTPLSMSPSFWSVVYGEESANESTAQETNSINSTSTDVTNSTSTDNTSVDVSAPTSSADESTTIEPSADVTDSTSTDVTSSESLDVQTNQEETPIPDANISVDFDDATKTSLEGNAEIDEIIGLNSLKLDGQGYSVEETSPKTLNAFSLSAWIKPDYSAGSSEFTIVSKEKAFVLALNNNISPYKVAKFSIFDGTKWNTVESITKIDEKWTHLVATFDGSSIAIYVDGNLESTQPIEGVSLLTVSGIAELKTIDTISSNSDIVIGAYMNENHGTGYPSNQFSGLVDDVKLYESRLESSQIEELYNQSLTSYYSSEKIDDYSLTHNEIEIGKAVTWTQNVVLPEKTENVVVELPADAQIEQIKTSTGENVDLSTLDGTTITEAIDNDQPIASLSLIPAMLQEDPSTQLVVINEPATEYNIQFETPAPYTVETESSTPDLYQKEVTVAHDSALHYTDVKSYSDIPEDLVVQGIPFKLYWLIDGVKTDVTSDPRFAVEFIDTDGNGISDRMQWIIPQLSEQQFVIEAQLTVINVQSYPIVGGDWTVQFTTVGTGDLVITGIDGTTFGDSLPADLKFLELYNGTYKFAPTIEGNSIIYKGYSSAGTGYETSQVLTSGKHHLEFRFGNDVDYANNLATIPLYPSNTGNSNQWVAAGSDKITAVSNNDGDGSYIYLNNGGAAHQQQTYKFPGANIPAGSTINSVTLHAVAKKIDGSGATKFVFVDGQGTATTTVGNNVNLGTLYAPYSVVVTINPFTGLPWTLGEVNTWISGGNAIYFGVGREDSANQPRATEYYVTVESTSSTNNHPPVAADDSYSTNEDTTLTVAASGVLSNDIDADNNSLTATIVSSTSHGTLTLNSNGGFTYTPAANYNGADSFTYKANDGTADSNVATVSITVTSVNDVPVVNNQSVTTAEDTAKSITLTGTDVEGSPLTFSVVSGPTHGALSGIAPNLTYTPAANYNGADSFTYQANDGYDNSNVATVSITVTSVNDAPILGSISSISVLETTTATFTAIATDPDVPANILTFSLIGAPSGASINSATGVFTWTPTTTQGPATYIFSVQVSDGTLTNSESVTITVNQLGPSIVSLTASDPSTTSDGQYGAGDTITIKFSEDTNKPSAATKSEIDAHYTFSQNLGTNYIGSYTTPSTLVITIVDATGATPPTIGGLTVTVTAATNLKNLAGTSLASTSTSPLLVGSFGIKSGPSITEFSVIDSSGLDAVYGTGDTFTIRFSEATNRPGGTGTHDKTTVDSIFTFNQGGVPISLGNSYTGKWTSTNTYQVTITDDTGNGTPKIGLLSVTVNSGANLKNLAGTSLASVATSQVLTGSFGAKSGPFITTFIANDPSGLSAGYGNGDALTITLSEATNRPGGTGTHDKTTVDSIFTFNQGGVPISLGTSYTGQWITTNQYRVTITDSTGNVNPQVSLLSVTVNSGANLKNSVGKSLSSTSTSPTLTGTFASPPGPSIIQAVATNPNNSGSFENGVTITIGFSEPTNQPSGSVDNIFTFSQGLGATHTGQWIAPDKYKITIVDATGNGNPQIGVTTITVNAGINLKNAVGNSLASTSSIVLSGSFGTPPGPSILDFVAADPDSGDAVYGNDDTITIRFSEATSRADPTPSVPGLSTSDINTMFTFSEGGLSASLGTVSGIWTSPSTLVITTVDATGATPPTIGGLTVAVNAAANLKNLAGTSLSSTSASPPLIGSFGNRAGPFIQALIADDPDSGDAVYGNDDTITVKFSEPTNEPLVATNTDVNNLLSFSQNIGSDITGSWATSSTLVLTVKSSNGATPPAIGELTVTVKGSANLKNAAGTSLTSASTSPTLTGSFGVFTESITVGDGGTATSTLPSGMSASITLPSGVEGTIEITRSSIDDSTTSGATVGIAGDVAEITPSDGASCLLGCPISFEFTQAQADAIPINPFDVKVLHDANEDGVFDLNDPLETLTTVVTQTGPDTFIAEATVDFNSKFAVGGLRPALLLGGLGGFIHSPPSLTGVVFSSPTKLSTGEYGFGGILESETMPSKVTTKVIKTLTPLILKLHLYDESGYSTIKHVAFYTNLRGLQDRVEQSDTYIIYDKGNTPQISDPNGYFANVSVTTSKIDNKLELVLNMTFAKAMDTSDIIIRSWDTSGDSRDTRMSDALHVISSEVTQTQIQTEVNTEQQPASVHIPVWIKNNAGWWSEGKIGDSDFVKGIQYLIQEGIITIPPTDASENVSGNASNIPAWVKTTAEWWADDQTSDSEFIHSIQWLVSNGLIKV